VSAVPAHEILPIAGPSHLNLSHEVDQQTVFVPSIPNAVSKPRPKPKARAKGKKKAPARDDSPTPHNSLETVDSQAGSNAGTPATLPRLRKSTTAVTDDIRTRSHDAVLNQDAPSTAGRKRKANNVEPPTAPAPKKVRVTRQTTIANKVVPQVQDPVSGTTTTNITSREIPASSSMVIDASPGKPGQRQLRRGRSRKAAEHGPTESVHADTAAPVKRGRGRPRK
jgi:hypothetical protein